MSDLYRTEIKRSRRKLHMKLPIPPSVNKIHYTDKRGVRRLTAASERYIRDVRALSRLFVEEQEWEKKTDATWLYMDMVFFFPDRRIRDSHNCLKILLDALEGIVFQNDYYVVPRIQSVEYSPSDPRVEVLFTDQTEVERQKHLLTFSKVVK